MKNLTKENFMISVPDALTLVGSETIQLVKGKTIALENALGFVLFKDVFSLIDMPPYRQSAMDGYAVKICESSSYQLVGEVKAGDGHHPVLKTGQAVRIFTGAPVPDTSDAVVMQEKVQVSGSILTIDSSISLEDNIRLKGEQIQNGEIALKKGTKLTPAAIGFLAGLGITKVVVFEKPSIAVITTGNELIEAGQPLSHGQIYESNGKMLASVLEDLGYDNTTIYKIEDNFDSTKQLVGKAIGKHDMVLLTGGISVGDYDFVGKALEENRVHQVFYKVKQKPGKPLFYGKKDNTVIFALPGNPAAALSCFYIYVHQVLEGLSGNDNFLLPRVNIESLSNFRKKGDRAQFLKAMVNNEGVTILEGQSSAMLRTFSIANALVFLPESAGDVAIGDQVEVILLPIN